MYLILYAFKSVYYSASTSVVHVLQEEEKKTSCHAVTESHCSMYKEYNVLRVRDVWTYYVCVHNTTVPWTNRGDRASGNP